MRYGRRLGLVGAAGLMGLLAVAPPTRAVEYRLQVVSLFDTAYKRLPQGGRAPGRRIGPRPRPARGEPRPWRRVLGAVLFDRRVSR